MHKTILVTGANGQLASEIRELSVVYKAYDFVFATKDMLDFSDTLAIKDFFVGKDFDIIINCAAYTAVDSAEEKVELTTQTNSIAVETLSSICVEKSISLIHISTDYIFDGKNCTPHSEESIPNPQSVYGKTKLAAEEAIKKINPPQSIIIRTSWLISRYGSNFVKTILNLGKDRDTLEVVFDQIGTPTYTKNLAKVILDIIPKLDNTKVEVYNYSNEGVTSWYDIAMRIVSLSGLECKVSPIQSYQYPTPAKRPHYSLLNKAKIKKKFNLVIPHWEDSLVECLKELGEHK